MAWDLVGHERPLELLRAALLLCDWPGSKTLHILQTMKHAGQSPMVRRLQQPPAAEHVHEIERLGVLALEYHSERRLRSASLL